MKRKLPKSRKIPGKRYFDYELARSFPIWSKYEIGAPVIQKIPQNSAWIIHWWRNTEELTEMDRYHLDVLVRAKAMFKKVIVFYSSIYPAPKELDGCYVVPIANDVTRGENKSFIETLAQCLLGNCDYVLRTHFKLKKNYDQGRKRNVKFWCKLMYDECFNVSGFDTYTYGAIDCHERHWLDKYLAALPGKWHDLVDPTYQNHYAGSFIWFNCKKFREWASKNDIKLYDILQLDSDEVQGKPWFCEVLITALFKEINAKYHIDFSPYYIFDYFILEGRDLNALVNGVKK